MIFDVLAKRNKKKCFFWDSNYELPVAHPTVYSLYRLLSYSNFRVRNVLSSYGPEIGNKTWTYEQGKRTAVEAESKQRPTVNHATERDEIWMSMKILPCVCTRSWRCYTTFTITTYSRDGVVGIATRYGLERQGIESRWGRDFPHISRPALRPTQPPIQCLPGLSWGKGSRNAVFTTHSHLVPRFTIKSRAIPLFSLRGLHGL
jgi:hypothetical protein